jgi:hypothetical protein
MKLLIMLVCALALQGQTTPPGAPQTVNEAVIANDAAYASFRACYLTSGECAKERTTYASARSLLYSLMSAELRRNDVPFQMLTEELNRATARLNSLVVCRRARRFWQVWKRCRH